MKSKAYWEEMVIRFNASPLGAKEFSKKEGIGESTLRRYSKNFSEKKRALLPTFEPLTIKEENHKQEARKLSIHLPNQICCEMEVFGDKESVLLLKELMQLC
jgi:hypothetical protein